MPNEYGDYQTPTALADTVTQLLNKDSIDYSHVIEPTFGDGSFILSAIKNIKGIKSVSGYEIRPEHYENALQKLASISTSVECDLNNVDFFGSSTSRLFSKNEHNLVIGNLPWITVSKLSQFESKNIPKKQNIKGLSGFDALTGKSNFDISEYIVLKLLYELSQVNKASTLAVLVKNIVAQNIMKYIPMSNIRPAYFSIYKINAKKEFNVSADAGLMVIKFNSAKQSKFDNKVNVYSLDNPDNEIKRFGWVNSKFVSNVEKYEQTEQFDSDTEWNWRSGIKHDAGKVMELVKTGNMWTNGLNETVELEDTYIYPLVKSSDVKKQRVHTEFRKYLLVPQKRIGEETDSIQQNAIKTWNYLNSHREFFERRKSSIYKKAGTFAVFGIGDYSFKPYKVAISGMYKDPIFAILPEDEGTPIMCDDTVNFVGFDTMTEADIFCAALNSKQAKELLHSLVFIDSKRPYTINILKRVDVIELLKRTSITALNDISNTTILEEDVKKFIERYSKISALF